MHVSLLKHPELVYSFTSIKKRKSRPDIAVKVAHVTKQVLKVTYLLGFGTSIGNTGVGSTGFGTPSGNGWLGIYASEYTVCKRGTKKR